MDIQFNFKVRITAYDRMYVITKFTGNSTSKAPVFELSSMCNHTFAPNFFGLPYFSLNSNNPPENFTGAERSNQ